MKQLRLAMTIAFALTCLSLGLLLSARAVTAQTGTIVNSATLSIYETNISGQIVYVHPITAAWAETEVTWENFGNSFDPIAILSFNTDDIGWHDLDVTSQVQAWLNNPAANYGLLFEQGNTYFTTFASSEASDETLRPKLHMCYTQPGRPQTCLTIQRSTGTQFRVADAYIYESSPYYNGGTAPALYTGLIEGGTGTKYALLRFELTTPTAVQLQSLSVHSAVSPGPALTVIGAVGFIGAIVLWRRRKS